MSQHDYVADNASGAAFRADLNNALAAIATQNAGSSAPSTTYAYMRWPDTTNGVWKRRNAANSGWLVEGTLDESFVLSRSSNTMLDVSDVGKTVRATGNYTQTFDAVATLGDGWSVGFRVESGVTLVLDPNSTETIDGATTLSIVGPASGFVVCNGSALYTVGFRQAAQPITASLGADVALNNTGSYFDGPSVAQGTVGTWFASGQVVVYDTAGAAQIIAKLWDGTTVIDEANINIGAANLAAVIHLSGRLATPAGNLRISVRDVTSTSGVMQYNGAGNGKACTLTAMRID